ncbi:MAG: sigma 54-interacting transcriptional regulator [Acidobacteriota bacterium]
MRILYVEDDHNQRPYLYECLFELGLPHISMDGEVYLFDDEDIVLASTSAEAIEKFSLFKSSGRPFTHAIVDLSLAHDADDLSGLEVVEHVLAQSSEDRDDCVVLILSNFTEQAIPVERIRDMRRRERWPDDVLNKPPTKEQLKPYFLDVSKDQAALEEKKILFGRSPEMESLLRRVKLWTEEGFRSFVQERQPLPALLLTGPSGSGKSVLGACVQHMLGECVRNADPDWAKENEEWEPAFRQVNGARYGSDGDGASIELFGAKNWGNSKLSQEGVFQSVTENKGRQKNGAGSGIVLLDEIDKIPSVVKDKLLVPISERKVETMGEQETRPVRGLLMATTAVSGDRREEEQSRHVELYNRMTQLRVPPLWERGEDDWRGMLEFAIRRRHGQPVEVQVLETAKQLIREYIESKKFNCRAMQDLASLTTTNGPGTKVTVSLGVVDRLIQTKFASWGWEERARRSELHPRLPGSLEIEWSPGDVVSLGGLLAAALTETGLPSPPHFRDLYDCSSRYFGEATIRRYRERSKEWRLGILRAFMLLSIEGKDPRTLLTITESGPTNRVWWTDYINPLIEGPNYFNQLRRKKTALEKLVRPEGNREKELPFRSPGEDRGTRVLTRTFHKLRELHGNDEQVRSAIGEHNDDVLKNCMTLARLLIDDEDHLTS